MTFIIDDETMYKGTKVKQYLKHKDSEIINKLRTIVRNAGKSPLISKSEIERLIREMEDEV